eukprot:TRINITY_DN3510_c0_g1_i1.p1 TRINITY_DN3510_c0_g1~~TRINITY_DN3510_c0_g1_i1.p1  ORF type:complete len:658 (+),score=141.48 TRINITY_DN3510_c0_g1_i1:3475-5448(+)
MDQQRRNFKREILAEQEKAQEQLAEIKKIQRKIELEAPVMREKIDTVKQQLGGDLIISEQLYLELKSLREDQLSLKDYVLIKVHETVSRYAQDAEKARKDLKGVKDQFLSVSDQLDEAKTELAHLRKKYDDSTSDSMRRINEYMARAKELESELSKATTQISDLKEKGLRYDEVSEQLKEALAREKAMQSQYSAQANANKTQTEEIRERDESIFRLKQELNILSADKGHLQKENVVLSEKNKRLEDKNDQLLKDLEESKKKISEYVDKLLNTKDDVVSKYESKYMEQLNDLKERHKRELESTKGTITEIYEKRIQYLTEAKDEAELKLARAEQDLKDKAAQYEDLLFEHRILQKKLDEECSGLRLELRFKADEVTKLSTQYEEQLHKYKEGQIEIQALRDKLDVLRAEYYKLESTSRQAQSDIRAENAMFKERLRNYEQIEQELDQAIVQASEGAATGSELGQALANTIAHAPTTAKRRIQQSLILSNKLLAKQKELDSLKEKLKEKEAEVERQSEEIRMYKRLSEKTNQPYSYLATGIEKAEKELYFAEKENKNKDQIIQNLKKEIEVLRNVLLYICCNTAIIEQETIRAGPEQDIVQKTKHRRFAVYFAQAVADEPHRKNRCADFKANLSRFFGRACRRCLSQDRDKEKEARSLN